MSNEHEEFTLGQLSGSLGKAETVRRMCRILYLLHEKRIGFSDGPCDCICPEKKSDPESFRSTGDALRWLEKLVEGLPRGATKFQVTERWTTSEYGSPTYGPPTVEALPSESPAGDGP